MSEGRLPTKLMIDAVIAEITKKGVGYYITQKGDPHSGLILLHLNNLEGKNILLTEQRDFDGKLKWQKIHTEDFIQDIEVSPKIEKYTSFDDDLWVIEIEDKNLENPFVEA